MAYQLIAPDTNGGESINRGFFAVNRVTGDTWELVLCKPISSASIRRVQQQLKRATKLPDADWQEIAKSKPCDPV